MRTYPLTLAAILLIGGTNVCAQTFQSGLPYSKTSFCPESVANATIPSKVHTGLNTQTLLQESSNDPNLKNRFSVGYAESINLTEDGLWSDLPNGDRIWRQQITADNALGLTVYFNHFQLGVGSELFVYDDITSEILWSYQHTDNRASFKKSIRFPMETVILELYEPAGNESQIEIDRIGYQYQDFCTNSSLESCYQDVLCSDYSAFSEVSSAVVQILVTMGDDEYGGTAAFINNSCNDGRPLLLTNHHNVKNSVDPADCDVDVNDQAQLEYAAIVLNCVRPAANCNETSVSVSNYQMLEGLAFVAQCSQTDMALVEYDGTIPENTNFYLAGWDASGTITDAASVIIHHTYGFPKKISVASSGVPRTSLLSDWNCIPTGTDYYSPVFGAGHNIYDAASGSPLIWTNTKAIYAVFKSNSLSDVCPSTYNEYTNTCVALDEAFQQCGFGTTLSPENNAIQSHSGMWFSDRNNQCEGDYWGDAGNGEGIGNLNCINEDPNDPNTLPYCSFSDVLDQNPIITGREYSDANRHLKAQLSIRTGVDDNGNGVVIKDNSDITFHAYHEIVLGDGFVVEEGSKFLAETQYCCSGWDLSQWRLAGPSESEHEEYGQRNLMAPLGIGGQHPKGSNLVPNPTTGLLTLIHTQQILQLEVYDAMGKRILQTAPNTNTTTVDLSGNAAGIYTVRATLEDGRTETHRAVLSPQ